VRRLAVALLACLLLASCTPGSTTSGAGSTAAGDSRVDVDTPALRALKAGAGVEPCPAGGGSNRLPAVRLRCLGGSGTVDLAGLRGPAVVNVGWSACAPCREEAPALRALAESGKVTVLMVDDEPEPDDGLRFAIAEKFHFAMVSDQHGTIEGALPVRGFPTTFFVRADGTLAGVPFYNALPTGAALGTLVSERLGVSLS
jgi:thiol-disulfide isomerase/thioredoxin